MNQTVLKYEQGDKKSIFGKPYTWNGSKWIPDEGVKTDNKGREKVGANVTAKEADKYLRENGLEHIDMLSTKSVRRLFDHHGIDWKNITPRERLNELLKIYGAGPGTKTEEKKPEEKKPEEKKPEEKKPEEKKPESEFTPFKTMDEAKTKFFTVVPSYTLRPGLRVDVETVNKVTGELHKMVSSPRIRKILEGSTSEYGSKKAFVIMDAKDVKQRGSRPSSGKFDTVGTYNREDGKITVGRGSGKRDSLTLGEQGNVGNAAQLSTVRHEFGHHMYYKDKEAMSKFTSAYYDAGINRLEGWNNPISHYASSSPSECFAECFSAFFHPDYTPGKKGKCLPDELHKVFVELYGNRW